MFEVGAPFRKRSASQWRSKSRTGSRTSIDCRHLLCLLNRFVKFSRQERPDGSLPAFAWDNVAYRATPMIAITATPSLFPSSSACYSINSPYSSFPIWESNRFTTFRLLTRFDSLELTYPPVGLCLRVDTREIQHHPTHFLVQACQLLWLVQHNDVYQSFTYVTHAIVS